MIGVMGDCIVLFLSVCGGGGGGGGGLHWFRVRLIVCGGACFSCPRKKVCLCLHVCVCVFIYLAAGTVAT